MAKASKQKHKRISRSTHDLVDAKTPLEITITRADVIGSKKMDPGNCAAAVAIKRQFHAAEVLVHMSKTYVKHKDSEKWVRYETPESMRREITSFDRSSLFEPGNYRLIPVSPANRLGMHTGGPHSRKDESKKRPPMHITVNVRKRAPRF